MLLTMTRKQELRFLKEKTFSEWEEAVLQVFSCYLLQNGDRRAAGHLCQHAWRVVVSAGCLVPLRRCQQPEEARLTAHNVPPGNLER